MKKWPSRWQLFCFRIADWWLKRNGFLTGYEDGAMPGDGEKHVLLAGNEEIAKEFRARGYEVVMVTGPMDVIVHDHGDLKRIS